MAHGEQTDSGAAAKAAAAASRVSLGLDETIAALAAAPLEQPTAEVMASITDQDADHRPGPDRPRGRAK